MEANEAKRKRLSLACNVCRRKKIKCDGIKPTCGKCLKQEQECSYSLSSKKRGPRQGHIEILEERLKKMEELITTSTKNSNARLDSSPAEPMQEYQAAPQQRLCETETQLGPLLSDTTPSMDVIQHLVDTYFQHCTMIAPIIDIEGFKSSVRNNTCSMFLLYSIMSVAARYSKRADVVESPLWMSGEKYGVKARALISQVIDNPSIENVQGLIILDMNEYGCGRGARIWMYSGLATRMAIEIGLHKEKVFEEGTRAFLPLEKWYWYETRRKVFWETLMHDKFTSAATGNPSVLDPKDCEIMLPVDIDVLDFKNGNDFYQASLDKTKLIHYHIVRDEMTNLITGIQMNPLDINLPEHRIYLNRVGWSSYILHGIVLLGKVSQFINSENDEDKPFAAYENNSEFEKLDNALDAWVEDLPLHVKNTPANLERYRNSNDIKSVQYVLGHILHNSLVVLLHRPSLVVVDLPELNQVAQETQDKVHKSLEKCISAANDVTVMIKDLCCQIEVIPPFISYSVYISSTVIVNSIFTGNTQENKQAESALKEYFRFFSGMKIYWAMADKLYLMTCDLYAIHQKVVNTCQNSQTAVSGSTNSSSSWNNSNNGNENTFTSAFPGESCMPVAERPIMNGPPTSDAMKNQQQQWNTQQSMLWTNNENGRDRSIFNTTSNSSVSAPSFDVWLRQQQGRSSS